MLYHGGNLEAASCRYGKPLRSWLDLSTGINPNPYPLPQLELTDFHRLPEPLALSRLLKCAARFYGKPAAAGMVVAPGSQALIPWLAHLTPLSEVAIVEPTYGEHRKVWQVAGHRVYAVSDPTAVVSSTKVIIVTNPNNPDGRNYKPADLLSLTEVCASRGGFLIVDEAFADLDPATSLIPWTGRSALIVLRSFGKFFGLAGLRVGFLFGPPALTTHISNALGPWPLAAFSITIATLALADISWQHQTRSKLASSSASLRTLLTDNGLHVIGGTSLFVLASHPEASNIAERLAQHGTLVRSFLEMPTWLRFGLPPDEPIFWQRLEETLRKVLLEDGEVR